MMGVFQNIQKILDTRLKALPSSTTIAWPNARFEPANVTQYLRPTLLMASTEIYTLANYNRLPGIYQIDIFGQVNRGVAQVHILADEIKAHYDEYKTLTEETTVLLIQSISLGQAERQDAWYKTYIEINFQAFDN